MSSGVISVMDQQQDQYVEDFETMETQYSTNVENIVSMLASLMRYQVKVTIITLYTFLSEYILISVRIYLMIRKMFSLLSLTLAQFSFSAFLLAV